MGFEHVPRLKRRVDFLVIFHREPLPPRCEARLPACGARSPCLSCLLVQSGNSSDRARKPTDAISKCVSFGFWFFLYGWSWWWWGQVSNSERSAKPNTNQLTREQEKGTGEEWFWFLSPGGGASIVPPKLRFHQAEPLLLAQFSAFPLWKVYQISVPYRFFFFLVPLCCGTGLWCHMRSWFIST